MTNGQTGTLVLKDATGSYFLVDMETVEQGRVPDEQTVEFERQLAEADDEVQGFIFGTLLVVAVAYGSYKVTSAAIESGKTDATTAALGYKAVATANDLNAQFPR